MGSHQATGSADMSEKPQRLKAAAAIAAALLSGAEKAEGGAVRLVADTDGPLTGPVITALKGAKNHSRCLRVEQGLPGHCLGQAAGLALALLGGRVFCLADMEDALSGSGLDAARFATGQGIANLTLVAVGPRPSAVDPAVLYAALGWQTAESGTGEAGLSRALSGCRSAPALSAVFIYLEEGAV